MLAEETATLAAIMLQLEPTPPTIRGEQKKLQGITRLPKKRDLVMIRVCSVSFSKAFQKLKGKFNIS